MDPEVDTLAVKDTACSSIDDRSSLLFQLSTTLWNNPEEAFEEHFAHEQLTKILKNEGFEVTYHYPVQTAFVAVYGKKCPKRNGLKVGICCEYDALPGIGHGCGHNLIAEASLAAGIAIKEVISNLKENPHEVVVIGTPAEENAYGGKVHLINAGIFNGLDICLMAHPYNYDVMAPQHLSLETVRITYTAECDSDSLRTEFYPNPLDAAVACYNNLSLLRQQVKPDCRLHGIIIDGGIHPDLLPKKTCLEYMVRATTDGNRNELKKRLISCAEGAGIATGCKVTVEPVKIPYSSMNHNSELVKQYHKNLQNLGLFVQYVDVPHGSTDMGNVSQVVPSIHPKFKIPSLFPTHTEGFAAAAVKEEAQYPTLRAAKALAMTAIDIMFDPTKAAMVRQNFRNHVTETNIV